MRFLLTLIWKRWDVSAESCPVGRAWTDFPSAENVAHADGVECSNMGDCNRETGLCECRTGFSGQACDRCECQPIGDVEPRSLVYKLPNAEALLFVTSRVDCPSLMSAALHFPHENIYICNVNECTREGL